MKKISVIISILAVGVLAQGMPEAIVKTSEFPIRLGYTVELPPDFDSTKSYPLIVAIHGLGDRMLAYRGTAQRFCPEGAIGLYPESPYPFFMEDAQQWGWTWWHWSDTTEPEIISHDLTLEQSVRWVVRTIEEVKRDYPVDSEKVFLFGFSQGGFLTFKVGLEYPHLFRGLLPAGGWIEFDTLNPLVLDSAALNLPVRILHGAYDEVVKPEKAQKAHDWLAARGIPVELLWYPVGHSLPPELFADCQDFCFRELYQGEVPPLASMLWPVEEMELGEYVQYLKPILCSDAPKPDIEAGLTELYSEQESAQVRERIIYLLGARRCTGALDLLTRILEDKGKPRELRNAAYAALRKLGTQEAWETAAQAGKQVVVTEVIERSQADELGILEGDVICRYNRKNIETYADLREAIGSVKPDEKKVKLVISRDDNRMRLKLEPGMIGIRIEEQIE